MTLCELSTSEYQPAPMECTEAGFSNKKCMKYATLLSPTGTKPDDGLRVPFSAFMRSPQQWTTYSSHMHNIRQFAS